MKQIKVSEIIKQAEHNAYNQNLFNNFIDHDGDQQYDRESVSE